jgi:hypothetical protein
MQQSKGTLIEASVNLYSNSSVICQYIIDSFDFIAQKANFKRAYLNSYILAKNEKGDSFIANHINYFYY